MIEMFLQLNWFAVLIASVAHFVLGGVWFGLLFGKQYAAALGIADRAAQTPAPLFLIGPFVCSAATIATTALLLKALHIGSFGGALVLGTIVAIGYLVPMTVNIAINPLFPRPFRYALLNAPMFFIGSLMACAIVFALN